MTKLSKREKVLLYILVCLVIIVGTVYFFIVPAWTQYTQTEQDLQTLQMQKQQLLFKAANLPVYQSEAEQISSQTQQLRNSLFSEGITPDTLDADVTQLTSLAGIQPENMTIQANEYKVPALYNPQEGNQENADAGVLVANLQISGTCSPEAFENLLDVLAQDTFSLVENATLSKEDDGRNSYHITLAFYLLP